jgi:hypothetical protein
MLSISNKFVAAIDENSTISEKEKLVMVKYEFDLIKRAVLAKFMLVKK